MKPSRNGRSFAESLEQALARVMNGTKIAIKHGVVAGSIVLPVLPGYVACGESSNAPADEWQVPGDGKADWAQKEGSRNPEMVTYQQGFWHQYKACYNRGGCDNVDVFLKLRVKPVQGANLGKKRVGVVVQPQPGTMAADPVTVLADYFSAADGFEEWHARVPRRSWDPAAFTFTAWYQDGQGNTFYDDNNGEFHAVAYQGSYSVVRQNWSETTVLINDNGVEGTITLMVADLDFDKDLKLVWTTDHWATVNNYGIGAATEVNSWHWVQDLWSGYEEWELKLGIPGTFDKFEYAIVYSHGVVNKAVKYDFWDNNGGGNYVVTKVKPAVP